MKVHKSEFYSDDHFFAFLEDVAPPTLVIRFFARQRVTSQRYVGPAVNGQVSASALEPIASSRFGKERRISVTHLSRRCLLVVASACVLCFALFVSPVNGEDCIPDGGIDDTLGQTHCCSGQAVPGSTYCLDPNREPWDYSSCTQICGAAT